MTQRIQAALTGIKDHEALNNAFYDLWTGGRLELPQLAIVAKNYGAFVRSFPDTLALLVGSTDDLVAKVELVKTLHSELGYGRADKAHSVLFDAFFGALGARLGEPASLTAEGLADLDMLPSTTRLIEAERELYSSDSATSVGAQLALEWQAYTMLRLLYDGARQYESMWDDADEFHEACEYFYVHIGEAEKEHKEESLSAALRYAVDASSEARVLDGFHRHLAEFARFWQSLASAMLKSGAQINFSSQEAVAV